MHPGRGGLEPVDDLRVVDREEDDADEADDEGDVVPCACLSASFLDTEHVRATATRGVALLHCAGQEHEAR